MIRVLVVDDSRTFRAQLVAALKRDAELEVVGDFGSGAEAIEAVKRLKPQVVTMDAMMPDLDGIEATRRIMATHAVPVIIVSAATKGQIGVRALEVGAMEVIAKPEKGDDFERMLLEVVRSVKLLSEVPVVRRRTWAAEPEAKPTGQKGRAKVIGIGASTGGPALLASVLKALPKVHAPVVITQHISPGFDGYLVQWWSDATGRPVRVAKTGDLLSRDALWVAPAGQNLVVTKSGHLSTQAPSAGDLHVPSVDVMLASLARAYGGETAGLVLTGMGSDGAKGLRAISDAGGQAAVQLPSTAVIDSMPRRALERSPAAAQLEPGELAAWIGEVSSNE
jgi:two-component system chemotaxis response regulator CheB